MMKKEGENKNRKKVDSHTFIHIIPNLIVPFIHFRLKI